jgi:hypothetical protein
MNDQQFKDLIKVEPQYDLFVFGDRIADGSVTELLEELKDELNGEWE